MDDAPRPDPVLLAAGALIGAGLVWIGAGKLTPWMLLGGAAGAGAAWLACDHGAESLWDHLAAQVAAEEAEQASSAAASEDEEGDPGEELG